MGEGSAQRGRAACGARGGALRAQRGRAACSAQRAMVRQLQCAMSSVPLHIAEGMYSRGKHRLVRYQTALGSTREAFACLETAVRSATSRSSIQPSGPRSTTCSAPWSASRITDVNAGPAFAGGAGTRFTVCTSSPPRLCRPRRLPRLFTRTAGRCCAAASLVPLWPSGVAVGRGPAQGDRPHRLPRYLRFRSALPCLAVTRSPPPSEIIRQGSCLTTPR